MQIVDVDELFGGVAAGKYATIANHLRAEYMASKYCNTRFFSIDSIGVGYVCVCCSINNIFLLVTMSCSLRTFPFRRDERFKHVIQVINQHITANYEYLRHLIKRYIDSVAKPHEKLKKRSEKCIDKDTHQHSTDDNPELQAIPLSIENLIGLGFNKQNKKKKKHKKTKKKKNKTKKQEKKKLRQKQKTEILY